VVRPFTAKWCVPVPRMRSWAGPTPLERSSDTAKVEVADLGNETMLSLVSQPTVSPSNRSWSSTRAVEIGKSFGLRTASATTTGACSDDSAGNRTRATDTFGSS
jgi:hypothetical protein